MFRQRPITSNAFQQWAVVALFLLAFGVFAKTILWPAFIQPRSTLSALGNDFAAYYMAAWETAQGHSPYHRVQIADRVHYVLTPEGQSALGITAAVIPGYVYPPTLALLLQPLTRLRFDAALTVWLLLNCALAPVCWVIGAKHFAQKTLWSWQSALLAVIVLAAMPMRENLLLGQINGLVLVLALVSFIAFRDDRPFLAGALLAVAAWLKLTPAFLLIYFVYHKRNWKFLQGFSLLSLVAAAWIVAVIGWQETIRYIAQILPAAGQHQLSLNNKAFLAIFDRLFKPNPLMPPAVHLPLLSFAGKGIVLTALFYAAHRWRSRASNHSQSEAGQSDYCLFAATFVLMLLCQPLLEIHHLIFTFPALAFLLGHFPREHRLAAGGAFVLICVMLNSRGWNAFAKWSEHWSSVFLIAPQAWGLLLLGALFFMKFNPGKRNQ